MASDILYATDGKEDIARLRNDVRVHQVPMDEEASKLLTIVTNSGRYSYKVLPQGVCKSKNLKLNPKKFFISEEVEFGGSTVSAEKCENEGPIFVSPKNKRILLKN